MSKQGKRYQGSDIRDEAGMDPILICDALKNVYNGQDEHTLISIFTKRSFSELRAIFNMYEDDNKETMEHALGRIRDNQLEADLLYICKNSIYSF